MGEAQERFDRGSSDHDWNIGGAEESGFSPEELAQKRAENELATAEWFRANQFRFSEDSPRVQ